MHYSWKKIIEGQYLRDKDPLLSALKLLNEKEYTKKINFETDLNYVSFTTAISDMIDTKTVEDVFVDATHNLESMGWNTFVVLVTYQGEAYPISYLIVSKTDTAGDLKSVLCSWLHRLKEVLNLNPSFFFTDKDFAEINAACYIWPSINIVLCWWHIKRAIKQRLTAKGPVDLARFDYATFDSMYKFLFSLATEIPASPNRSLIKSSFLKVKGDDA